MVCVNRSLSTVLVSFGMLLLLFAFILLLAVVPAHGQSASATYPVFEGFLGASVGNNDYGASRYTMPGWHLSFALNPRHNFRVVADFAGQLRRTNIVSTYSNQKVRLEEMQFLWGPEYTFRQSQSTTPFVHALFGIAGRHYYTPSGDLYHPRDVLAVDYGFASGIGGGIDFPIARRWAIRAPQFDYGAALHPDG